MRKLDFHVHCDSADPAAIRNLAEICEKNDTIACLSGGPRYGSHDHAPNEEVLKVCREHEGLFVPLAKFDLWEKVDARLVHRYAEQGFRALKFIYPYYEYDHDNYMPVYEAAEECGLPLLFHTGNFRPSPQDAVWKRPVLKNMNPMNLDRIARSFPKLHIVMAHLGTTIFRAQAAEYIKMHPNLYADLAGNGSWGSLDADHLNALLNCCVRKLDPELGGFKKLVYGSDAYATHPEIIPNAQWHYENTISTLGLPQEYRDAIMGQTVASWLGIKL